MPLSRANTFIDDSLFNLARPIRCSRTIAGSYTRQSGSGNTASFANTGGFSMNLSSGVSAAGNSKCGYFDPTNGSLGSGSSTIDYSKRIRFALFGMISMTNTLGKIRVVFGGTGNSTNAPASASDGLTVKGFGCELALQSGLVQGRLIGFNSAYLTPTSYTTLTNGFGNSTLDTSFFALMIESDGIGNIKLYGAESSLSPNILIGRVPLLTLTGGPTTSTSSNRFGPEIQCVNDAGTGGAPTQLQSNQWALDVQ